MLKPITLCIKNSLLPERKLAPGNPQPPNPSQCDFYQAAALIIWLACSSGKLSPLYLLCAGSGGTSIKPRGTLSILVVRETAPVSAGGTALRRVVSVPSCRAGVRFRVTEGLAEGCGSCECLVGSMGDRRESVRAERFGS